MIEETVASFPEGKGESPKANVLQTSGGGEGAKALSPLWAYMTSRSSKTIFISSCISFFLSLTLSGVLALSGKTPESSIFSTL